MDRRELLGVLGTTGAGLVAMSGRAVAPSQQATITATRTTTVSRPARNVRASCNETFRHCYDQVAQGKKEHAKALRLVVDCAQFCNLSSDMVASDSPLMVYSCAASRGVQVVRVTECDKHEASEMKNCAKACYACEKTCRAMVSAVGGRKHVSGE